MPNEREALFINYIYLSLVLPTLPHPFPHMVHMYCNILYIWWIENMCERVFCAYWFLWKTLSYINILIGLYYCLHLWYASQIQLLNNLICNILHFLAKHRCITVSLLYYGFFPSIVYKVAYYNIFLILTDCRCFTFHILCLMLALEHFISAFNYMALVV